MQLRQLTALIVWADSKTRMYHCTSYFHSERILRNLSSQMNMTVLEQQASCLIHFPWIWDYRRTFGFEVFFREKFFEVNEASFVLLFHVITELDLRLKSGKLQRRLQGNWVIPVDNGISVNDIRLSRACLCIGSAWSRVIIPYRWRCPKKVNQASCIKMAWSWGLAMRACSLAGCGSCTMKHWIRWRVR